jgi:hypothetical protein
LRGRAGSGSPRATVIAHIVHGSIVDNGLVIDIGNVGRAYVVYFAVVIEPPVIPISALIADARITVAIVDAAVETDLGTPISGIPDVDAVAPAPIARSPEQTDCRDLYPCAWDPVVAIIPVRPISGCPDKTFGGTRRLLVHGQRGWRDVNGHGDLRL